MTCLLGRRPNGTRGSGQARHATFRCRRTLKGNDDLGHMCGSLNFARTFYAERRGV